MEVALRTLHQGRVDIRVMQEMKLTQGIHTGHGAGYDIWETEADICNRGGNGSGVESENGVADRGICQLRPKHGKFLVDDAAEERVRSQGLRAPKQRYHYHTSGTGSMEGGEGCLGNSSGGSKHEATRTVRSAGGITCNGGGGPCPGVHDSKFHSKEEVQRRQPMDMADEKGGPTGDGSGGLNPLHK